MQDRIIVALDFEDFESAKNMVEKIGDQIGFYKIGLELMASGDYFKMIDYLKNNGKKVFADLKLYDIPQTVGKTVKNLAQYDIDLLTIHASSRAIMREAVDNKGNMNLLAVTILTCLDESDLDDMGFNQNLSVEQHVINKAKLAYSCGIDGVVASSQESRAIRGNLGNDLIIATPGIRLGYTADDQKRVTTPHQAIKDGSDYLIIGRPITKAQDPRAIITQITK